MATLATGQNKLAQFDRRRQLASALTQQAVSANPIVHPLQGYAKLAQALAANHINKGVTKDEDAFEQKQKDALAAALDPVHATRIESRPTAFSVPGQIDMNRAMELEQQMGPALDEGAELIKRMELERSRAPSTQIQLEQISESPKTVDERLQDLAQYDPRLAANVAADATLQQLLIRDGVAAETTDDITEYKFAKNQGYPGGLEDWLDRNSGTGTDGAPSGYRWTKEGDLEYIPSGPADPKVIARNSLNTPEQAAKVQLLKSAGTAMDSFREGIVGTDANGNLSISRMDIANMNLPGGGTPFSDGRRYNVLLKEAIEAKLRAESGAAVPQTEVERAAERFRPRIVDDDATIMLKMQLLQQFVNGAYDMANKNGKFDPVGTVSNALSNAETKINEIQNSPPQEGEVIHNYSSRESMQLINGQWVSVPWSGG